MNPNDQGEVDIETKVNTLQSQISDISTVLEKLTRTLVRFVNKDPDMTDCRGEFSDYRTIDRVNENDVNMHTLPNDADQSHIRSLDSQTQTHSNNVCVDRPIFQFRSNIKNEAQSQTQTRQTAFAKPTLMTADLAGQTL